MEGKWQFCEGHSAQNRTHHHLNNNRMAIKSRQQLRCVVLGGDGCDMCMWFTSDCDIPKTPTIYRRQNSKEPPPTASSSSAHLGKQTTKYTNYCVVDQREFEHKLPVLWLPIERHHDSTPIRRIKLSLFLSSTTYICRRHTYTSPASLLIIYSQTFYWARQIILCKRLRSIPGQANKMNKWRGWTGLIKTNSNVFITC